MSALEILEYISAIEIPVLQIVFWAAIFFWVCFSVVITYHWLVFNRNKLVSLAVLAVYFIGSLSILGLIITTLPYVSQI